jgi:2-polyprenyl-3-methyl-5-hydroxy-6-metoxy-1,4-benzoquinol methylase
LKRLADLCGFAFLEKVMGNSYKIITTAPHSDIFPVVKSVDFANAHKDDPIRFYSYPLLGRLYRRRVEYCLDLCQGGEAILEVGFGSGATFPLLAAKYNKIYGVDLDSDIKTVEKLHTTNGLAVELQNGNVCAMPYDDGVFDTVLLISILEHLQPEQLQKAMQEIRRVLKPGGNLVYGVPIERPMMVFAFKLLGYNIGEYHFSTEKDIASAAEEVLGAGTVFQMLATPGMLGPVYEVGLFIK